MSLEEEEYDGTGDEEGSESDYSEGHVSQLRFLSGKKWKKDFVEVVNASIEPPPPLPLELDLNVDNQVILAMIERWWPTTHTFHLHCGELGITPRDFTVLTGIGIGAGEPIGFDESSTDYGNAIRAFPDMMPTDYEKGCISFAHLRTYLDHTKVNIRDLANAKTIFKAFMLLYFGGVLFGNSKSWARLELLCPIAVLENKAYTIDFGSAILGHLYYYLDQASKQEYHCYEYCQIGHHILIDNRHVSHGALMSDIARCGNIDIPGLGALISGVTFPRVEFPTADFSAQETQIPPPRLGDYPGWIIKLRSPHGTTWHTIPSIASTSTIDVAIGYDFFAMTEGMRKLTLDRTLNLEARHLHNESRITQLTENLRRAGDRLSQTIFPN
ncbi:hypothetical protein GIB67_024844 [Kingdonia uniflora]|uniref:Aminotransferase-like plant mobile domain-containing protein n=1 Tax=Kingdonia uniflora TaxID=39325 RepID=A0A7J7NZ09_9MAGN|nr:hypothetical protein GIB67_024844 [Kingdonia uniflora]